MDVARRAWKGGTAVDAGEVMRHGLEPHDLHRVSLAKGAQSLLHSANLGSVRRGGGHSDRGVKSNRGKGKKTQRRGVSRRRVEEKTSFRVVHLVLTMAGSDEILGASQKTDKASALCAWSCMPRAALEMVPVLHVIWYVPRLLLLGGRVCSSRLRQFCGGEGRCRTSSDWRLVDLSACSHRRRTSGRRPVEQGTFSRGARHAAGGPSGKVRWTTRFQRNPHRPSV